jgi:hypothetical protein
MRTTSLRIYCAAVRGHAGREGCDPAGCHAMLCVFIRHRCNFRSFQVSLWRMDPVLIPSHFSIDATSTFRHRCFLSMSTHISHHFALQLIAQASATILAKGAKTLENTEAERKKETEARQKLEQFQKSGSRVWRKGRSWRHVSST